jgi:hypothetical protein
MQVFDIPAAFSLYFFTDTGRTAACITVSRYQISLLILFSRILYLD